MEVKIGGRSELVGKAKTGWANFRRRMVEAPPEEGEGGQN